MGSVHQLGQLGSSDSDIRVWCRHYVENLASYIMPEEMQRSMRSRRGRIGDEAWPEACQGLVQLGVHRSAVSSRVRSPQQSLVQGSPALSF